MDAFPPLQSFLLGFVVTLLGLTVLWFLLKYAAARWQQRNPDYFARLARAASPPPNAKNWSKIFAALPRPLRWLLGTRGRAVYRATYHTHSLSNLCSQIEESVRASCPGGDGAIVRITTHPFHAIRAYRGMTSGFLIQLLPDRSLPGDANGLVVISRWSRWHTWGVHIATGCFFLTLFASMLTLAITEWQIPGIGFIVLGLSFVVAVLVTRLLLPLLAAVENVGRKRLTDEEVAALVGRVRAAVESGSEVAVAVD